MKSSIIFLFVVIIMFSCKKSDSVQFPIDTEAIRAQLVAVATPSKEAVQAVLSSTTTKLKDAEIEPLTLVQIFPLDSRTFEVYDSYAIKNLLYAEIDQNGYRQKWLGLHQQFQIKNGVIDTTSSTLSYEVGCPYSRYFTLTNQWDISRITYTYHFDDGRQFSYFGENNNNIKIIPIAGAKCQLDVVYDDGDMRQEFISDLVNFYAESNILSLRLGIKKENIVSIFQLNKDFIKKSYLIQLDGEDDNGNFVYMTYPVIFDESIPATLSFSAPFQIKSFIICGANGCYQYDVKIASYSPTNGQPLIYIIK